MRPEGPVEALGEGYDLFRADGSSGNREASSPPSVKPRALHCPYAVIERKVTGVPEPDACRTQGLFPPRSWFPPG